MDRRRHLLRREARMRYSFRFLLVVASFTAACSHKQPSKPAPATPSGGHVTEAVPKPTPASTPVSPNLAVADDLGKECSLRFSNKMQAPKFDFDQFQLLPEDRDILDQVATCITTGPLKGRKVYLVGRTDPRGTDEYNLALGDRRARSVVDYLKHLGVNGSQVAISTRGELDASGTDESSWRIDRRVDLQLMN
jgi:peptidoglycan-associated lipoprotein